jgi:hypothetical protein
MLELNTTRKLHMFKGLFAWHELCCLTNIMTQKRFSELSLAS